MAVVKNLKVDKFNPDTDVYCGRKLGEYPASRWGNPFRLKHDTYVNRLNAIKAFKEHLHKTPELLHALPELVGKNLACWCHPNPCHCHVLHRYVNKTSTHERIVLTGSRSFDNLPYSKGLKRVNIVANRFFDQLDKDLKKEIIVIHGNARGWDRMVADVALKRGYDVLAIPAMWHDKMGRYNSRAGFERNSVLISLADRLFAGHDGVSRGTLDAIKKAPSDLIIDYNLLELK